MNKSLLLPVGVLILLGGGIAIYAATSGPYVLSEPEQTNQLLEPGQDPLMGKGTIHARLIGEWHRSDKSGDTYVFKVDGSFVHANGSQTTEGWWRLKADHLNEFPNKPEGAFIFITQVGSRLDRYILAFLGRNDVMQITTLSGSNQGTYQRVSP